MSEESKQIKILSNLDALNYLMLILYFTVGQRNYFTIFFGIWHQLHIGISGIEMVHVLHYSNIEVV